VSKREANIITLQGLSALWIILYCIFQEAEFIVISNLFLASSFVLIGGDGES